MKAGVVTTDLPLRADGERRAFTPEGADPSGGAPPSIALTWAHGDYFSTFGIPLIRGRNFTPEEQMENRLVVIVSKNLADRYWPGQDPIGKRLKWGLRGSPAPWQTVVGVAGDVVDGPLGSDPVIHVYVAVFGDRRSRAGEPDRRAVAPHEDRRQRQRRRGVADPSVRAAIAAVDPALAVAEGDDDGGSGARSVGAAAIQRRGADGLCGRRACCSRRSASTACWRSASRSARARSAFGSRSAPRAAKCSGWSSKQGMVLVAIGLAIGLAGSLAAARVLRIAAVRNQRLRSDDVRDRARPAGAGLARGLLRAGAPRRARGSDGDAPIRINCKGDARHRTSPAGFSGLVRRLRRLASAQSRSLFPGTLDQHPAIDYRDGRIDGSDHRLQRDLTAGRHRSTSTAGSASCGRCSRRSNVPVESQILVFSKTGIQHPFTNPENPRALYFNDRVVVGYIPGAPMIEMASHDPRQGVIFQTLKQEAGLGTPPHFVRPIAVSRAISRRTASACPACSCAACSPRRPAARGRSLAARSSITARRSTQRWGGWYVTGTHGAARHMGNAMVTHPIERGEDAISDATLNRAALDARVDASAYPWPSSDITALMVFDHQGHAMNLLTRLGWEARIAGADGAADFSKGELARARATTRSITCCSSTSRRCPRRCAAFPGLRRYSARRARAIARAVRCANWISKRGC